jgi:hypothetical protein
VSLPRIIALCGHARHGKDTIAEHLAARYGYARYSLAAPLKAAVLELFGWAPADLEGEAKERIDPRWGLSPRQALQALGTEYGQAGLCTLFPEFARVTGRKLWIRRLLERAGGEARVVVSDCRFPHEAEEIHAAGGIVVRVHRPSWPVDLTHESERAVSRCRDDYLVVNSGSLDDLRLEVDRLMHQIGGLID